MPPSVVAVPSLLPWMSTRFAAEKLLDTYRFVEVELVLVVFVKTPVEAIDAPIGVLLIEPPVMVVPDTFPPSTVMLTNVPPMALSVVPEAVVKPIQVAVALVKVLFVPLKLVAKRLVLVVFVPVAFVQMKFVKLEGVVPLMVRFVIVALVAKKFVLVELVLVVFVNTPVDAVVAPIGVLLMEPPVMVTPTSVPPR